MTAQMGSGITSFRRASIKKHFWCSGATAVLYGYAGNWIVLPLIAAVLQGIAVVLVLPTVMEGVAHAFDMEHRGRIVSRLDAVVSIAELFSPTVTAGLFAVIGVHRSFLVIGAAIVLAAPSILVQSGWKPREVSINNAAPVPERRPNTLLVTSAAASASFANVSICCALG